MSYEASAVDWAAVAAVATIALAVVTALLAGATFWLGAQTRDVSIKTGQLATTTGEEMDLLREQARATRDLVSTQAGQIEELREARFAEFLPMLRWQQPDAFFQEQSTAWRIGLVVLLTNEGPGPARLRDVVVTANSREDFSPEEIGVPSTLPSGERIAFSVVRRTEALERREREISITIRYADLLGEFEYETVARVAVNFEKPGTGARFLDSDERLRA